MTVELFNTVSKLLPIRFVFPPPDGPGKNEFWDIPPSVSR